MLANEPLHYAGPVFRVPPVYHTARSLHQSCNVYDGSDNYCCVTGDWAAFMQASVVQPEAPATAVLSHDSSWDAFQGSDAAAPASIQASAAAPFDPFGESQTIEAAPAGQKVTGGGGSASASAAGLGTKRAPKRSADDIMKMFDKPQQNTFAQFTAQGMNGAQQPQTGAFAMQQVSLVSEPDSAMSYKSA